MGIFRNEDLKEYTEHHNAKLSEGFSVKHPNHVERISKHQLSYSILGLLLGTVCIFGGLILFINGIAGSTSWTANLLGAESSVSDATPGTVLFIVGLLIVFTTRYGLSISRD